MDSLKDIMKYAVVIDTETTINATNPNHFGATPFDPKNKIVALGSLYIGAMKPEICATIHRKDDLPKIFVNNLLHNRIVGTANLFIGHNIAFDLQHCLAGISDLDAHKILGMIYIWDTMIAEYYLTRQECKMISLESLAARYGIPFKKDETVSESFKAGIGADKIDPKLLDEYLDGDVRTTRDIFFAQQKKALEMGGPAMVEYLIDMMGARLTTMIMERNGCVINRVSFSKDRLELEGAVENLRKRLEDEMSHVFGPDFDGEISIGSPKQVHTYLFGGEIKTKTKVNNGTYKSGAKKGEPKYNWVHESHHRIGAIPVSPEADKFAKIGSVDTKVLKDMIASNTDSKGPDMSIGTYSFIIDLMRYRTICKDLGTYETYEKQFYYTGSGDTAILHPNFNHALTHTKRPSCNQPNLQNVSNKETIEDLIDEH